MCYWKQWKRITTKHDNLVLLGLPDSVAWQYANTRKSYWHTAHSPILTCTLTNDYFHRLGLISFSGHIVQLVNATNRRIRIRTYGGVRGQPVK